MTLREQVELRDLGICALCGIHTGDLETAIWACVHVGADTEAVLFACGRRTKKWQDGIMWEADHIVPKCEGGPDDLSNLRTLCLECHYHQTVLLRKRLRNKRHLYRRRLMVDAMQEPASLQ